MEIISSHTHKRPEWIFGILTIWRKLAKSLKWPEDRGSKVSMVRDKTLGY